MTEKIKAKDKFLWEPDALCPPPIYVRITTVKKYGGLCTAECWQGSKHWKRAFPLPLPPTMRRHDWNFEEIGQVA